MTTTLTRWSPHNRAPFCDVCLQALPCFPVSRSTSPQGDVATSSGASPEKHGAGGSFSSSSVAAAAKPVLSSAQDYGSKGFRALTKLKSQQVLRILQLGYDVVWSDVDIFWKINPIPGMLEEMADMDIGIQSNAPPEERNDNGRRRINSGLYLVKSSPATVQAFQLIVDHAR